MAGKRTGAERRTACESAEQVCFCDNGCNCDESKIGWIGVVVEVGS